MTDLTDRQRQVLEFIDAEVRRRGLPAERARDRRGRRPLVELHGPRPPRRPAGQGLPPARPDQAPRDRDRASSPAPARSSTGGPCATSRSSATSPPAPACSRPRTSRRRCPLPEDLTGDGELFMLRVRGESMIDAGILDGDYVVVRQQPTADNGDIVVAGIPGEEATVKTFLRTPRQDRAAPREPDDGRDGLRPRRDHDLRQGRHAPAPPLTAAPGGRDGRAPAPARTAQVATPCSRRMSLSFNLSWCSPSVERAQDQRARQAERAARELLAAASPAPRRTGRG